MSCEELKFENKLEGKGFNPTFIFNLGIEYASFLNLVNSFKSELIPDFSSVEEEASTLAGEIGNAGLPQTQTWFLKKLENLRRNFRDFKNMTPPVELRLDQQKLKDLRENIQEYFSLSEIQELASNLGFDYEDLSGTSKNEKTMEFVSKCKREWKILELARECTLKRPHVRWLDGRESFVCLQTRKWRDLQKDLEKEIKNEFGKLSLIALDELDPPPSQKEIKDIRIAFKSINFDAIPPIAKSLFQEALNCFACGFYTAAVNTAWSAAKTTLEEYYHRLYIFNAPDKTEQFFPTWNEVIEALPDGDNVKQRVAEKIHLFQFAMPDFSKHLDAWTLIEEAIRLSSSLVTSWKEQKYDLVIEIHCPLDKDVLIALILLEIRGGIGKIVLCSEQNLFVEDFSSDFDSEKIMKVNDEEISISGTQSILDLDVLHQVEIVKDLSSDQYERIVNFMGAISEDSPINCLIEAQKRLDDGSEEWQIFEKVKNQVECALRRQEPVDEGFLLGIGG